MSSRDEYLANSALATYRNTAAKTYISRNGKILYSGFVLVIASIEILIINVSITVAIGDKRVVKKS